MIKKLFASKRALLLSYATFIVVVSGSAGAATQTNAATEALIERVVALSEYGDPAAMEKTLASYLIESSRKFNPTVPDDTWKSIRSEVDGIISRKVRSGYGEQALLARHFVENAKFSDDELRHLITILQDPIMRRWAIAMRDGSYMATLTQQVNKQMWFIVSIVLRRHGLQTTDTSSTEKQSQ